jgi:hypothetical protein
MADPKNGKGFSGFDDLVSDISKDLEEANAAADSQPTESQSHSQSPSQETSTAQTSAPAEQTYTTSPTSGPFLDSIFSTRIFKWAAGIFIVLIAISFLNQETEKKKDNSYVPRPERATSPAPAPAPTVIPEKSESRSTRLQTKPPPKANTARKPEVIAPAPVPAPPRMDSTINEITPAVGTNSILGRDQIRYCLSEKIRMGAMKDEVNLYAETEVDRYNSTVQDYNSRCSQFRYRQGSLESVSREVETQRSRLQTEGALRIKKLRGHSSSTTDTGQSARKTKQVSITQQKEFLNDQSNEETGSTPPGIDGLNQAERSSIESACDSDKVLNGPAAYNRCLSQQLASLRSAPRNIDLSSLNQAERSSIKSACNSDKVLNGPAAYNRCLQAQLLRMGR